jgi:hypothetical protein
MSKSAYLGDGAYATVDQDFMGQIILTTETHDSTLARNVIHLGENEAKALVRLLRENGHTFGGDNE